MLTLAFVQAPFLHFHEHEENEQHPHTGFFHLHFHHHHPVSSKPAIGGIDPDDDAVFQSFYAHVSHDLTVPVALLVSVCEFTVTESPAPYVDRNILGGHDPPPRSSSAPRAPPL
jgi:hypothetical protein